MFSPRSASMFGALLVVSVLSACAKPLAPPTAVASAKTAEVAVGAIVELDGSQSKDANEPPLPLFFRWSFKSLPPGSAAALNDPTLVNPSFTADVAGTFVVTLVTSSGNVASVPVDVSITAGPCGGNRPAVSEIKATPDKPGIARAVQLTATAADADNEAACGFKQALRYEWTLVTLPPGSRAALNQKDAENPSFTTDVVGDYQVRLVVTDSTNRGSEPAVLKVTASGCGGSAPSVALPIASPDTPNIGDIVSLTAKFSDSDNDKGCDANQTHGYRWFFVSLPTNSRVAFNDPEVASPSFIPDLAGDYVARARVTDSTGRMGLSPPATVKVSVCGGGRPQVKEITSLPVKPNVGQTVQLATRIDDKDSDPLTCNIPQSFRYSWRVVAQPADSLATLNNPEAANPSFRADRSGEYALTLAVEDATGLRAPLATFKVTVEKCGSASPTVTVKAATSVGLGVPVQVTADVKDTDKDAPCLAAETFTYAWSFDSLPTGSKAALNDTEVDSPSFTPDVAGPYLLRLVVKDAAGHASDPAFATVTATACGGAAPVAKPTFSPASPGVGLPVLLAAAATDADNDAPCSAGQLVTFNWSFDALPAGSKATLNSSSAIAPSFTPDVTGDYTLRLVATDSTGRSSPPASLKISVSGCGAAAPSAKLTASTTAPSVGQAVLLTGTVTDTDNDAPCNAGQTASLVFSFASLPAGSQAVLNSATAATPSFVPDIAGAYELRLVATDSTGRSSAAATITVTATSCGTAAPVAVATVSDAAPPVGKTVLLGTTITDADNDAPCSKAQVFSHQWSFESLPAGSGAALNNTTAATPSFTPDVTGEYVARVVVIDSTGRAGKPATVKVTASSCGAAAPVGKATASNAAPAVGELVQLVATATDTDNDAPCLAGQTFAYFWAFDSLPAGSRAALNNSAVKEPSFTPDVAGDYVLRLLTRDSTGKAGAPVSLTVKADACGGNRPSATVTVSPASVGVGMAVKLVPAPIDADNGGPCQGRTNPNPLQSFSFAWTLLATPAGSTASLSGATAREPGFMADQPGTYVARLVVTDSTGRAGDPIETTITANSCGSNSPTVVTAVSDNATPNVGTPVLLSGTFDDADNGNACQLILGTKQSHEFIWSVVKAPSGSRAGLANADTLAAGFTPDVVGEYQLNLTVEDSTRRIASKGLTVTAASCGTAAPTATPSLDQSSSARVGGTVLLRSNASDPDNQAPCSQGQALSFDWRLIEQPAGSRTNFGNRSAKDASFVPDVAGTYVASLEVADATGKRSAVATLTITVSTCGGNRPVASISGPTTGNKGVPVQVDALGASPSTDADNDAACALGQALFFRWEIFSAPKGSNVKLEPTSTVSNPSFKPDETGPYVLRLMVTDSTGLSSGLASHTFTAN